MTKKRFSVRRLVLFIVIILLVLVARPVSYLIYTNYKDHKPRKTEKPGYSNDASNLNETKVEAIIKVPADIDKAIEQVGQLIKQAVEQKKKISIAGAQHSMGGHTIYPNALVLDMKTLHYIKFDSARNILLVSAGTLWSEIIPYLDKRNKAISVMQSNNSFSVGGSISVNCHGWQPNAPPIASTVESFRLINAEGKLITCNRNQNKEMFSLVLGGYGLFGVIIDVELRVVDNKMYKARSYLVKSKDYIKEFNRIVRADSSIGLAYGRININPDDFMEEAIISTYKIDETAKPESLKENGFKDFRRTVFRGSANSDYGKNLRWKMEKASVSLISGKHFSRNRLSNEGVEIYQNTDTSYTDILHEYFIPENNVLSFIDSLKKIIPAYKCDLLNITLRNIEKDNDSFLAYATQPVLGFVMLYNQAKDSIAENEMRRLTRRLIDIAIKLNGNYYLPYRLHATREQMHHAYTLADSFFLLKKKYDPNEIFQNQFYQLYK